MSSSLPTWIGLTLNERYTITELLGRGGMSTVYLATDPNLQRDVAVKIIHPHLTDDPEFVRRFEREATTMARLRHTNIASVYDFNSDGGVYYMVLEYIPGDNLKARLAELSLYHKHLPISTSLRVMIQLCSAVQYAHERHMIHRDIKPANIMIDDHNRPVLMDFGMAKIINEPQQSSIGTTLGNSLYISPEQARGDEVDYRADIYTLGIVLYEMLVGHPPFNGDSAYELILKHINDPVPDMDLGSLDNVSAVVAIVEKALSKRPQDRYQTAIEMRFALEHALGMYLSGSRADSDTIDELESIWKDANRLFETGDYTDCIDVVDRIEDTNPDYRRDRVQKLRQRAMEALYGRALNQYLQGDGLDESLQDVGQLQRRQPDLPGLDQLVDQVGKAQSDRLLHERLERKYAEAVAYLNSRQYERALVLWQQIDAQRGVIVFPDREQVEVRATKGVCDTLYRQAAMHIAHREPEQALNVWQQVISLDGKYSDNEGVVARAGAMLMAGGSRSNRATWPVFLAAQGVLLLAIILGSWLFQFSPDRLLGGEAAYMDVGVVSAEIQKLHSTAVAEEIAQLQPTATPVLLTPTPHLVTVPEPTAVPATIRSRSGDASLSVATVPAGQADEASALVMGEATSIAPQMARALQPSSVFSTPDSTSAELGLIELNDEVEVLGRTQVGNWLYVSTDDGALGFVFRPRFELMVEDDALMLIDPAEVKVSVSENAPASSAPADTSGQPLELDAFPLAGMGRCVDEYWVQTVYLEGRGGDGIYTYYWEDTLVAGPLIGEGFAFDVRHTGGQLIGTATVESGDGQSFSIELFVRQPEC